MNARQSVDMDGFRRVSGSARGRSWTGTGGRLLDGAGRRLLAHVLGDVPARVPGRACSGSDKLLDDPVAFLPDQPERADAAIEAVRAAHAPYWTVLR